MFLLIVATIVLIGTALVKIPSAAAKAEPAVPAPKQAITSSDFLKSISPTPSKPSSEISAAAQTLAADSDEALFKSQVEALWKIVSKYQIDCRGSMQFTEAEFAETLRQTPLKRVLAIRGKDYAQSQILFIRETLGNEETIKLCRAGKTGLFLSALEYHREKWDRGIKDSVEFETSERNRIAAFENAEAARVTTGKMQAWQFLIGAGIAFGLFISVALLLVFARIESNLRGMTVVSKPVP